MWKFALAAFLPTYFVGWSIAEPGRYRGAEGLGAGFGFLAIGLIAFYVAKRKGSRRPSMWGTVVIAASFGLALLGA